MTRFFNVNGVCRPEKHYMVNRPLMKAKVESPAPFSRLRGR